MDTQDNNIQYIQELLIETQKDKRRSARDILIDLLSVTLNSTYPISDLPARAKEEIVLYDRTAFIIIPFSQPGVEYQLYDDVNTESIGKISGNGGEISIETKPLTRE